MSDLTKHTNTELLKLLNDNKENHDKLKEEIIVDTHEFDKYVINKSEEINKKIERLNEFERIYVDLLEELNNRDVIR